MQVRGQEHDGASNMRGEFNVLQSSIMRENSSAYFHSYYCSLVFVKVSEGVNAVQNQLDEKVKKGVDCDLFY
jgi:hypothetical protein